MWTLIILTILIASLYLSVGIAQKYLHSLYSTQVFLILTLDTHLTDIISWLIVLIFLNITLTHLCYISKDMCSDSSLILTNTTFLNIETWKTIEFLLEGAKVFITQLAQEQLLCKARVPRILTPILDISHSVDKVSLCYVQCLTKLQCIKMTFHLVGYHHNVISWLIKNQQLTIPISDRTT